MKQVVQVPHKVKCLNMYPILESNNNSDWGGLIFYLFCHLRRTCKDLKQDKSKNQFAEVACWRSLSQIFWWWPYHRIEKNGIWRMQVNEKRFLKFKIRRQLIIQFRNGLMCFKGVFSTLNTSSIECLFGLPHSKNVIEWACNQPENRWQWGSGKCAHFEKYL